MKQTEIVCPACGASVPLVEDAAFVKCGFCSTQVVAPRPAVDHRAQALSELNDWLNRTIAPYAARDPYGKFMEPEKSSTIAFVLIVFGFMLSMAAMFIGLLLRWPLIGFAAFFVINGISAVPGATMIERTSKRHKEYKRIEAEYHRRRQQIDEQFSS